MGVSRSFQSRGAEVDVTVVEPAESPVISDGTAGTHTVQRTTIVGPPPLVEQNLYDHVRTLPTEEGIGCVQQLARKDGLLVGTSTGKNISVVQQIAAD